MTRASVLASGRLIAADDVREWLIDFQDRETGLSEAPVGLSLQQMERKLIEATLRHFDGHRKKTAEALNIGLRTLSGKLREYGYPPRANCPTE